jgi:hypothetical protein
LFRFQFGKSGRSARFRVFNGRIGSGHMMELCPREAIRSRGFQRKNVKNSE